MNAVSALETEAFRWPIRKNRGPVERLRPEPAFCSKAAEILAGLREKDRDRVGQMICLPSGPVYLPNPSLHSPTSEAPLPHFFVPSLISGKFPRSPESFFQWNSSQQYLPAPVEWRQDGRHWQINHGPLRRKSVAQSEPQCLHSEKWQEVITDPMPSLASC